MNRLIPLLWSLTMLIVLFGTANAISTPTFTTNLITGTGTGLTDTMSPASWNSFIFVGSFESSGTGTSTPSITIAANYVGQTSSASQRVITGIHSLQVNQTLIGYNGMNPLQSSVIVQVTQSGGSVANVLNWGGLATSANVLTTIANAFGTAGKSSATAKSLTLTYTIPQAAANYATVFLFYGIATSSGGAGLSITLPAGCASQQNNNLLEIAVCYQNPGTYSSTMTTTSFVSMDAAAYVFNGIDPSCTYLPFNPATQAVGQNSTVTCTTSAINGTSASGYTFNFIVYNAVTLKPITFNVITGQGLTATNSITWNSLYVGNSPVGFNTIVGNALNAFQANSVPVLTDNIVANANTFGCTAPFSLNTFLNGLAYLDTDGGNTIRVYPTFTNQTMFLEGTALNPLWILQNDTITGNTQFSFEQSLTTGWYFALNSHSWNSITTRITCSPLPYVAGSNIIITGNSIATNAVTSSSGGGGVTSLNGQTGAVTIAVANSITNTVTTGVITLGDNIIGGTGITFSSNTITATGYNSAYWTGTNYNSVYWTGSNYNSLYIDAFTFGNAITGTQTGQSEFITETIGGSNPLSRSGNNIQISPLAYVADIYANGNALTGNVALWPSTNTYITSNSLTKNVFIDAWQPILPGYGAPLSETSNVVSCPTCSNGYTFNAPLYQSGGTVYLDYNSPEVLLANLYLGLSYNSPLQLNSVGAITAGYGANVYLTKSLLLDAIVGTGGGGSFSQNIIANSPLVWNSVTNTLTLGYTGNVFLDNLLQLDALSASVSAGVTGLVVNGVTLTGLVTFNPPDNSIGITANSITGTINLTWLNPVDLALDFGLIAMAFAVFYYLTQTFQHKMIGKYGFLLFVFLSTFQAYIEAGSPNWLMVIWQFEGLIIVAFLWLDILIPFLTFLRKWLWHR